jgi:hypothetical protein
MIGNLTEVLNQSRVDNLMVDEFHKPTNQVAYNTKTTMEKAI